MLVFVLNIFGKHLNLSERLYIQGLNLMKFINDYSTWKKILRIPGPPLTFECCCEMHQNSLWNLNYCLKGGYYERNLLQGLTPTIKFLEKEMHLKSLNLQFNSIRIMYPIVREHWDGGGNLRGWWRWQRQHALSEGVIS